MPVSHPLTRWFRFTLLALACLPAFAGDRGSGHFRKGDKRIDIAHVVAVSSDEDADPAHARTYVFLSDVPLDAEASAACIFLATTPARPSIPRDTAR